MNRELRTSFLSGHTQFRSKNLGDQSSLRELKAGSPNCGSSPRMEPPLPRGEMPAAPQARRETSNSRSESFRTEPETSISERESSDRENPNGRTSGKRTFLHHKAEFQFQKAERLERRLQNARRGRKLLTELRRTANFPNRESEIPLMTQSIYHVFEALELPEARIALDN